MPIFMDRHDVDGEVTAEQVAHIHQQDLKVQDQYNCKVISYFFDSKRNNVFCLVEAPDKESMDAMHEHSHGQIANKVIEVEESILETFLGSIERPKIEQPGNLYINRASATRVIMAVHSQRNSWENPLTKSTMDALRGFHRNLAQVSNKFNGRVADQNKNRFLVSFKSASEAVACAIELQTVFNRTIPKTTTSSIQMKIGISMGAPLTDKDELFESAIQCAERISSMVKEQIAVSFEVKTLYENENVKNLRDDERLYALNPSDEKFLTALMDYFEETWSDPNLTVSDFSTALGLSKSQLYRKMVSLTGKSPNALIKTYRLNKALKLLDNQQHNITEIAYEVGFNSPAYFSKCFMAEYGVLPSEYHKQGYQVE